MRMNVVCVCQMRTGDKISELAGKIVRIAGPISIHRLWFRAQNLALRRRPCAKPQASEAVTPRVRSVSRAAATAAPAANSADRPAPRSDPAARRAGYRLDLSGLVRESDPRQPAPPAPAARFRI